VVWRLVFHSGRNYWSNHPRYSRWTHLLTVGRYPWRNHPRYSCWAHLLITAGRYPWRSSWNTRVEWLEEGGVSLRKNRVFLLHCIFCELGAYPWERQRYSPSWSEFYYLRKSCAFSGQKFMVLGVDFIATRLTFHCWSNCWCGGSRLACSSWFLTTCVGLFLSWVFSEQIAAYYCVCCCCLEARFCCSLRERR